MRIFFIAPILSGAGIGTSLFYLHLHLFEHTQRKIPQRSQIIRIAQPNELPMPKSAFAFQQTETIFIAGNLFVLLPQNAIPLLHVKLQRLLPQRGLPLELL